MTEEFLQIVDENTGEPTGEHLPRKEVLEKKLWCRTTNIFVLNSKGEILCHQRSLSKERFPGAWSTHFGGHITEGESFKISALKELEEETGLKVNAFQLIPWRTSRKIISRIWVRDFITVFDGDISELKIQKSEIEQVKWFNATDILLELDAESEESNEWLAGTHDFNTDYQCMRAVLTATIDAGIFGGSFTHLKNWHPPSEKNLTTPQ
ncbi:MAG: isopentenyl-diphosphate Delta-isomerase [Patescibacteria group bacterium]|nr:isopentenyl-diphosphate Delta-isomerase [Patescibacteria group bacterium]